MPLVKCDQCQVGRCRPAASTYMRQLGPHMVVFPDAPADKCDMCGHVNFDPGFLLVMQSMFENMARSPQKGDKKQVPVTDLSQEWNPVRSGS